MTTDDDTGEAQHLEQRDRADRALRLDHARQALQVDLALAQPAPALAFRSSSFSSFEGDKVTGVGA